MVSKSMPVSKTARVVAAGCPEVIVVRSGRAPPRPERRARATPHPARSTREAESEAGDVIDLGAPRLLRRAAAERLKPARPLRSRPPYTPNPRLYPGPRPKPKPRSKRAEARGGDTRGRRRNRVFRRPVPNARLYRPAPPRPPPPPAWPRASWPPPAPPAPARLDTASRAALRLSEQRRGGRAAPRSPPPARAARSPARAPRPPPPAPPAPPEPPSRRLVVTLPVAPAEPAPRYRPASEHFRLLSLDTDSGTSTPAAGRQSTRAPPTAALAMDAGNRHSTSPEDCSDGNDTLSAPSEFLAEFLSAIMRRQYAEALKYCRLILQYEPHNATARGFYPLLQHKVQAHKRGEGDSWVRGSSSEEASAHGDKPPHAVPATQELMEQGADESDASASGGATHSRSSSRSRSRGSCASQSSLELDSSDAPAHSSDAPAHSSDAPAHSLDAPAHSSDAPAHSSPSLSLSRRTDRTDSASGGCWDSSGSASRSDPDDNGNAPLRAAAAAAAAAADENDNAAATHATHKSESESSLRRLRAQFTCSIK